MPFRKDTPINKAEQFATMMLIGSEAKGIISVTQTTQGVACRFKTKEETLALISAMANAGFTNYERTFMFLSQTWIVSVKYNPTE